MTKPPVRPAMLLLGNALRELRTSRGISLRTLGHRLGLSAADLSSWELATRRPKAESVALILGHLQVRAARYRQLMELYEQSDRLSYVEEHRPDATTAQDAYEKLAVRTCQWAPHVVPEILQTPEYIQATLRNTGASPDDIDQAIFARQVRQLDGHKSCERLILVGESAWPSTVELPRLKNVTAQIVPGTGGIDGFTIYETESDVSAVVLRHEHVRIHIGDPGTVERYRSTFARLRRQATGNDRAS